MAVSGVGEIAGSVSGGCVEGAVVLEAQEALGDGQSRLLSFGGVDDGTAFAAGLACGGQIKVLVEPVGTALPEAMLADLVAARAARAPRAYVVNVDSGGERHLTGLDTHQEWFRKDRSGFEPDGQTFVAIHNPPPLRLVVVGAAHIAQALIPMARLAGGFDPVLIDRAGGPSPRWSGFPASRSMWISPPTRCCRSLGWTRAARLSPCPMTRRSTTPPQSRRRCARMWPTLRLGSTRTHAKRVERLTERGFSAAQIARIHAPVGLDIGAVTPPAEIAVAVLAQMVACLRKPA